MSKRNRLMIEVGHGDRTYGRISVAFGPHDSVVQL